MEVRVRERLIGALVLVTLAVLLVPALLRGPQPPPGTQAAAPETKSIEVTIDDGASTQGEDELMPEPEAAAPVRANPAEGEPSRDAAPPRAATTEVPAETPPRAQPASTPPDPAAPTAWAVQLGAFSTRDKAEGLVANLRRRGYAAFVLEYRAGGQVLHRVRVGPEQDRARAVAVAQRLRQDGFQPVVAPHP
ncbi:MAG: SPOR domain-containing protein [Gammaproteobacteria bacterium]